jgi:DNA polymerase
MNGDLLRQYLAYYRDLGVKTVYRRVPPADETQAEPALESDAPADTLDHAVLSDPVPVTLPSPEPLSMFELPSLAPPDDSLEKISADIGDCRRCRLCEQRNKIVFGVGNPQSPLVFVGEGPGADEDAQGIPFVGRAGQLLTQMIENTAKKEGIPLLRDQVYICNVVKCRPPDNRTPLPDEMEICGQFLFRQLAAIRPKAICALGSTAAKALLGTKEGVMKLRGNWQRWRDIPVMVTYHPSYLLRPYNQNAKREAWEDLKKLLHFVYD